MQKRGVCGGGVDEARCDFYFFLFSLAHHSSSLVDRRKGLVPKRLGGTGTETKHVQHLFSLFLAAGPRKVSWTDGKSKRDVDVIPLPIYLYHSHNGPSQKRANKKKKYKICAVVTGCVLALTLSVSSQTSLMTARPSPHSAPCCCPPNEMTWRLRKG